MDAPLTVLGRGVVVGPDAAAPAEFTGLTRVVVDDAALAAPEAALAILHAHWLGRRPVVIELTPDEGRLTVAVRPLEPGGLRECEEFVHRLVGVVEVDGEGLVMRAG